ncbi:hypothetical protein MKX01_021538 [Papaver californicum]|nr:hypothetical protein MKX01_021538 [Papaver californicum]
MDDAGSESHHSEKEFYIPNYILLSDAAVESTFFVPECPVLVFINSKSGGQLGGNLLITYRGLLNKNQVFDLEKQAPDKVLNRIYINLERLKLSGDEFVAGGDGTASWLLGVISDLKLSHPPPVATVPLGTGKDLPFSFGWGKKNPGTDPQSVRSFMSKVMKAKEMKIDSWHIIMRMRVPEEGACDPIAPVPELDLPHSMHAFHRVSRTDSLNKGWMLKYHMHFIRSVNCIQIKNQLVNQGTYAKLVVRKVGFWLLLCIPHPGKLNRLQSGACLPISPLIILFWWAWGTPNQKKSRDRDLTAPYVDDGLIEVVGFRDAWHGLVLLAPKGHGTRLAQAHIIRFEFHKGAADSTYMRIDGEPWKQPFPVDDDTVVVEISHLGQVNMLAAPGCISKSVYDPSSPSHRQQDDDRPGEQDKEESEERRKFGAADTFKLPADVDISQLS